MDSPTPAGIEFKWPWRTKPQVAAEVKGLLDLLEDPAVLVDKEHGFIYGANAAFLRLTTFDSREVVGKLLSSLIAEFSPRLANSQEMVEGSLQRRNREPVLAGMRLRQLDSRSPWLVVTFFPDFLSPEETTRRAQAIGNFLVTMARLPCGEGRLKENLSVGVHYVQDILGPVTVCVYQANPQELKLDRIVLIGEQAWFPESIPSADLMRLAKPTVWRPGKHLKVEIHKTGRVNNLEYVASVPLGQPGSWFGLLVVADTTQPLDQMEFIMEVVGSQFTRLIEQELLVTNLLTQNEVSLQSLASLQGLVDNAGEGMMLVSPDMNVKAMNPTAEWMLGYAEKEVKGQPVENILIGPVNLMPVLTSALAGVPAHNLGSVSLHRRNGQLFPAHVQVVPVGRDEQVNGLAVFIADISENEESRIRTQQLEQRAVLGDVTAIFAHEVRNPINNIFSGLQLLAAVLPEDDPNQENLGRLQHDCMRLNHLMESVLNFSRTSKYTFEEVDVKTLLQRIVERWRPRFAKANVIVNYLPTNKQAKVAGDARALEQVFTNLIGNAVEAMTVMGGTLSIKLERGVSPSRRAEIEVTVSDTGPGIPDEIRERIFEPFVSTKSQGTGLGLAITKRIVTAHHGGIQVNSFPGGTVFTIKFPAYQSESA